jgi:hypothetical protein
VATFLILLGICAWWPDLRAAGELASEEGIRRLAAVYVVSLSDELSRIKAGPLLDVGKTLVAGSLIFGVVLLVVLGWLSSWFGRGT